MYQLVFKRLLDIVVSLLVLIIASPVLLVVALMLFLFQKTNPFFFQNRPGKNERIFKLVKFKTMSEEKDKHGHLLPDKDRLTVIGKFVRKTSLDELPQLINVLKGDMSLIGPRPLLVKYLPLYNQSQRRRHEVRPGITGWAQVNGRNELSWEDKFNHDVWYVENLSFLLDLKILWKTVLKVLKTEGISSKTDATMEEFKGSSNML
jgi:lipopolysaccharide/colanic/teichoic acid biosynthesis glycosyltransferase